MNESKNEIIVQGPHKRSKRKVEIKEPKTSKMKWFLKDIPRLTYNGLYGLVIRFFRSLNRKAGVKIADWLMKCETMQHVDFLIRMVKWVVLPVSLVYVCVNLYMFKEGVLDSMGLGILIFLYSSFLPDLPSIFRRKLHHDVRDMMHECLPWYKKYSLLLFAPIFIAAFFGGIRLKWRTTETFHNFKSLAVYDLFLFVLSSFVFGCFPISIGNMIEILSLPLYGFVGYFSHLRVDLCI